MRLFFSRNKEDLSKLTDEQLIGKYRAEKKLEITAELFGRYQHLIIACAVRYLGHSEAQDVTMDVYELLVVELLKTDVQNMNAWLYTVTKNHCLKISRAKKREAKESEDYTIFMENTEDMTQCNEVINDVSPEKLKRALEKLKQEQQTCIQLFYLESMRYKQIALQTGYTEKAVKSHVQNGKRKLKIILTEDDE